MTKNKKMKYRIEKSPYKLGQKVFIITGIGKYAETRVSYLSYWMCEDKKQIVGIPRGIVITHVLFYDDYIIPQDDGLKQIIYFNEDIIFKTNEEAKRASTFVPLNLDISPEQWIDAIGDRDTDIEDCDLPQCCAIISEMRSILIKCKEFKGLIQRDVDRLQFLAESHRFCPKKYSVLESIFTTLNMDLKKMEERK